MTPPFPGLVHRAGPSRRRSTSRKSAPRPPRNPIEVGMSGLSPPLANLTDWFW